MTAVPSSRPKTFLLTAMFINEQIESNLRNKYPRNQQQEEPAPFLWKRISQHSHCFPLLPSLHLFFRFQYTAEPVTEHRFVFHVERLFEDQPVAVESYLLATAVEME